MYRLIAIVVSRLRAAAVAVARSTWEQVKTTVADAWRDLTVVITMLIFAGVIGEVGSRIAFGEGW
ncbi:hypothetical protein LCGC14_2690070, partial [marine sediment metagenome]